MAMEAKLGQELRLRQQLVMTPQLQQAIKILQLAVPDLEIVVQAEAGEVGVDGAIAGDHISPTTYIPPAVGTLR